jgi:hypothetical protein
MNPEIELTDDAIREMFERRAERATPGDLREAILARTVAIVPGRRSWWARLRHSLGDRTPVRALALVIITAAILVIGVVVAGSRPVPPAPTPIPSPRATEVAFVRRFEYQDPSASNLTLISRFPRMLAFSEDGGSTDPYERTEDGSFVPGARGITISSAHASVTHPCPLDDGGSSRVPIREDPAGFLDDLRAIAGVGLGQVTTTSFDGRPALTVRVDPRTARCDFGDFHTEASGIGGGYVLLTVPTRLVVTEVDGMTIVLQAWAGTEEELQAWLPTATEFLDSVHFIDP